MTAGDSGRTGSREQTNGQRRPAGSERPGDRPHAERRDRLDDRRQTERRERPDDGLARLAELVPGMRRDAPKRNVIVGLLLLLLVLLLAGLVQDALAGSVAVPSLALAG